MNAKDVIAETLEMWDIDLPEWRAILIVGRLKENGWHLVDDLDAFIVDDFARGAVPATETPPNED